MGKKTRELEYNLRDRGYKHNGQDRSNVDLTSMVNAINSPSTQERVDKGILFGWYGHQIRQRFGMIPPETAVIDGKVVRLEPAIRTISIKAEKDGTVRHVEEFLPNDSGQFAQRQYESNIGGFSTAQHYKPMPNGKLSVSGFYGMDYVIQTNYATNVGDGVLFDGLAIPEHAQCMFDSLDMANPVNAVLLATLDQQIISGYDSIHAMMALARDNAMAYEQVADLSTQLVSRQTREERLEKLRKKRELEREQEGFDSFNMVTRPFAEVEAQALAFLNAKTSHQAEALKKAVESAKSAPLPTWLRF